MGVPASSNVNLASVPPVAFTVNMGVPFAIVTSTGISSKRLVTLIFFLVGVPPTSSMISNKSVAAVVVSSSNWIVSDVAYHVTPSGTINFVSPSATVVIVAPPSSLIVRTNPLPDGLAIKNVGLVTASAGRFTSLAASGVNAWIGSLASVRV